LNDVSPELNIRGLNALGDMACDWTVALLEEAINDPSRGYSVRRHAIAKLGELLKRAIDQGYTKATKGRCRLLVGRAHVALKIQSNRGICHPIQEVEDLCDHLGQAVADGFLGQLPDF
jgi:hypothetical protein